MDEDKVEMKVAAGGGRCCNGGCTYDERVLNGFIFQHLGRSHHTEECAVGSH